jgi:hypothetical protein
LDFAPDSNPIRTVHVRHARTCVVIALNTEYDFTGRTCTQASLVERWKRPFAYVVQRRELCIKHGLERCGLLLFSAGER